MATTINLGPRSTKLDGLTQAIESHPIWTELRVPVSTTKNSVTTSYSYAGSNNDELVSEATTGGDTYQDAYGRSDQQELPQIEEETRISGGTTAHAYITHDNIGLPILLTASTGTVAMYVYDGQNNPVGLTTNSGSTAYAYQFDPYGGATLQQNSGGAGVPQNPYLYAGGLQDRATGYLKFGQRWYDPTTGTWTQQDTLNAPLDPGNANRYVYAADNPINNTDPTGQGGLDAILRGVAILGATALAVAALPVEAPAALVLGGVYLAGVAAGGFGAEGVSECSSGNC